MMPTRPWQMDIPAARDCGLVRCVSVPHQQGALPELLVALGLKPLTDRLIEFTAPHATSILEALLWRDMAYRMEIMRREKAGALAGAFMAAHPGARYFSNADWSSDRETIIGWTSLTDATFDGGIIAIAPDVAACVWIEDED